MRGSETGPLFRAGQPGCPRPVGLSPDGGRLGGVTRDAAERGGGRVPVDDDAPDAAPLRRGRGTVSADLALRPRHRRRPLGSGR